MHRRATCTLFLVRSGSQARVSAMQRSGRRGQLGGRGLTAPCSLSSGLPFLSRCAMSSELPWSGSEQPAAVDLVNHRQQLAHALVGQRARLHRGSHVTCDRRGGGGGGGASPRFGRHASAGGCIFAPAPNRLEVSVAFVSFPTSAYDKAPGKDNWGAAGEQPTRRVGGVRAFLSWRGVGGWAARQRWARVAAPGGHQLIGHDYPLWVTHGPDYPPA